MTEKLDPYKELGVGASASEDEIRMQFRKLIKEVHSDTGGEGSDSTDAKAKADRVIRSYKLLTDAKARHRYDETGQTEAQTEETLRQNALVLISQLLNQMIEGDIDPNTVNMIGQMSNHLNELLVAHKVRVKRFERSITRAERSAKKLKRKRKASASDGDGLLASVMLNLMQTYKTQRDEAQEVVVVLTKAIAIVNDYDFEADAPPASSPSAYGGTTMGGGFIRLGNFTT